jgi:hypothetical protein
MSPDERITPIKIVEPETFLPKWAQLLTWVGVPSFLTLFLLGAIPGMASPIDRITMALSVHNQTMLDHESAGRERQQEVLRVLKAICYRLPPRLNTPPCDGT